MMVMPPAAVSEVAGLQEPTEAKDAAEAENGGQVAQEGA